MSESQRPSWKATPTRPPSWFKEGSKQGLAAKDILDNGMVVGMNEVGVRFKRGDMFVPEVLMSADAMQAGLEVLRPHLVASGVKLIGKILMGTVKGDLHDIGKNLVGMMCEGAGLRSSTSASTSTRRSSSRPSRNTSRTWWACRPC